MWDHHLHTLLKGRSFCPQARPAFCPVLSPRFSSKLPQSAGSRATASLAEGRGGCGLCAPLGGHNRLCGLSDLGPPQPPTLRKRNLPSSVGASGTWKFGEAGEWGHHAVHLPYQGPLWLFRGHLAAKVGCLRQRDIWACPPWGWTGSTSAGLRRPDSSEKPVYSAFSVPGPRLDIGEGNKR